MRQLIIGAAVGAGLTLALFSLDIFTTHYTVSDVQAMSGDRFEYLVSHGGCREIEGVKGTLLGLRCPRIHLP